jgi:type I restriction enzyme M protein
MTPHMEHSQKTKRLIDDLKAVCSNYGLANSGPEYKIITEVFLYKYLNDKFFYEARMAMKELKNSENIEKDILKLSDKDYEYMLEKIGERAAKFKKEHFISNLFNKQNEENFAETFDNTLIGIADLNIKLFSVSTTGHEKIRLFDTISNYIHEKNEKSPFCKALINKMVSFSFEPVFKESYDFFSTIFEYLVKDYNKDSGKYAEYYTPHSVAHIIAKILVPEPVKSVILNDPAAGTGSLVLALAHQIGEDKCTIFTQDISIKSSEFLRLNLILNNLVHSLHNVIKGNTLTNPYHLNDQKNDLKKFDYIVSNPPFKTDFSDEREILAGDTHKKRFFAGVPNVPNKDKKKMAIYLLFIQHIIYSLASNGKAAVVVPTGFLTAQSGIEKKIREKLVNEKMLKGVVSMPSNIFANTGTNVSVVFIDKANAKGDIILMDASKLGETVKDGDNQRTVLRPEEENDIINTFNSHKHKEDFSVIVTYDQIKEKNCSFSAGQYFEVKIDYTDITPEQFKSKMNSYKKNLDELFEESKKLESEIKKQIAGLKYE